MNALLWMMIILMTLLALYFAVYPLLKKASPLWLGVVFVALPVFSLTVYLHFGTSQKLEQYWALVQKAKQVKTELAQLKSPQVVIKQLEAHLTQQPESARGWYLLGKLYLNEQVYSKAYRALNLAHDLKPQNTTYAVAYAQAAFFYHHKTLRDKEKAVLENVIARAPDNINAINLLAINAYTHKNYAQAVRYWEKMIPLFAPKSDDRKALLMMIARAQKKLVSSS